MKTKTSLSVVSERLRERREIAAAGCGSVGAWCRCIDD